MFVGDQLLRGRVPFADFNGVYGPLLLAWFAAGYRLAGADWFAALLQLEAVSPVLCLLLAYWVSGRALKRERLASSFSGRRRDRRARPFLPGRRPCAFGCRLRRSLVLVQTALSDKSRPRAGARVPAVRRVSMGKLRHGLRLGPAGLAVLVAARGRSSGLTRRALAVSAAALAAPSAILVAFSRAWPSHSCAPILRHHRAHQLVLRGPVSAQARRAGGLLLVPGRFCLRRCRGGRRARRRPTRARRRRERVRLRRPRLVRVCRRIPALGARPLRLRPPDFLPPRDPASVGPFVRARGPARAPSRVYARRPRLPAVRRPPSASDGDGDLRHLRRLAARGDAAVVDWPEERTEGPGRVLVGREPPDRSTSAAARPAGRERPLTARAAVRAPRTARVGSAREFGGTCGLAASAAPRRRHRGAWEEARVLLVVVDPRRWDCPCPASTRSTPPPPPIRWTAA